MFLFSAFAVLISLSFAAVADDAEPALPAQKTLDTKSSLPLHPPLPLEARFHQAEWVSLISVEGLGTLVNPSMTKAYRFSTVQAYNYLASVQKNWKGGQPESFKFRVDFTDCQQVLELDGEYIVFGVVNIYGKYQSMSCDDIIAFDSNASISARLDQLLLSEPMPTVRQKVTSIGP